MIQVGNYLIEDLCAIDDGSYGAVSQCKVWNLSKTHFGIYAKKKFQLPAEMPNKTAHTAKFSLRDRFINEMKAQWTLNNLNHNLVPQIYIACQDGDAPFFIMEEAECNLADLLNHADLPHDEKVSLVLQVLDGVKLIHDNNYIHRDLKPQNILRFKGGFYKIADFGLAKDLTDERSIRVVKTQIGVAMGTQRYMSQEAQDGEPHTIATEVYALGVIIQDVFKDTLSSPSFKKLKDVIKKCMSTFPEDRYQDVESLTYDVKKVLQ